MAKRLDWEKARRYEIVREHGATPVWQGNERSSKRRKKIKPKRMRRRTKEVASAGGIRGSGSPGSVGPFIGGPVLGDPRASPTQDTHRRPIVSKRVSPTIVRRRKALTP